MGIQASLPSAGNNIDALQPSAGRRVRFAVDLLWASLMTAYHAVGFVIAARTRANSHPFQRWSRNWARRMFAVFGIAVESTSKTSVEAHCPCVFVANHQNALDIPALAIALPVPFGFVAKASLRRVPFLGVALTVSPSVFVDGSEPRKTLESMEAAARAVREGKSVIVFPEGVRTWSRQLEPFKKRAFRLAAEAGVPVIPVTILDAHLVMDERRWLATSGTIRIIVGGPIVVDGTDRSSIALAMDTARQRIESNLRL